ncbi:MAG: TIGR03032 family protein [Gomphosphaeria aponina SAG 52.96 = DSM 107014]|uniref:TIGR03032 family protein n=1 Tax=Gomphosphaeria aponina SAG 52.96 = DSM 107014 TaxID=1521640 RepID=A0A941GT21_9CHRO|nr:TIGR03032 family protein [Gomphosphaeria aponina SAG 52.96 = DSM 107014]
MTQNNNSSNSKPVLEINSSRHFTAWLYEQKLSLAFTTYQGGMVFLIGLQQDGQLSVFQRKFERCMGLYAGGNTLYLSSLYQIWRLENTLEKNQTYNGYDCIFLPQVGYVTGDLDVHDVAVGKDEKLYFVNTLFSCLATVSEEYSFTPLWKPPFISKLAAEDRCHLNGLAMKDGLPGYVTVVSQSDVADGWRDKRVGGGCLIHVLSNEIVATGLSMPHSPRWGNNQLWVLNSGEGEFGYIDLKGGTFEPMTFCPGYLRGFGMYGDFAVVGISQSRDNKTFSGLPLSEKLLQKNTEPRCGLLVIDLRSGDIVHWLRIEGVFAELYDVAILPGKKRPMAYGFKNNEIRRVITFGP